MVPLRARGQWLIAATAVVGLALVAGPIALDGFGEATARTAIRATARLSLPLFLAAFSASALRRRWPGAASGWLLARRRQVGLSFAVSHGWHAVAITLLYVATDPEIPATTVYGGGVGYAFVAAMAATSFDRTAAWLGPARWRRLHTLGGWVIFAIFAVSYVPAAVLDPTAIRIAYSALIVASFGLRIWPPVPSR